jgi:hypothetical protein
MVIKDLKEEMDLKRCLFIENGRFTSEEASCIYGIFIGLEEAGVQCRVVERAYQNKKDVFEGIKWCDSIFFSSTFLHQDQIRGLGDLIRSIREPKKIFGKVTGGEFSSLSYEMESIWEISELAEFAHHEVYEIEKVRGAGISLDKVNVDIYASMFKELEKERAEKNKGFKRTGRIVRIKNLQSVGKQWSNLKQDSVAYELDCTSIDPNPSRGTWVMGLDEPVKLLNDSNYEEWEYDDLKASCLAREFFSRGSKLDQTELIEIVAEWIKHVSVKVDETELWDWCNNLCETVGVERRGNRSYFEKRLNEYRKKHTYFKER